MPGKITKRKPLFKKKLTLKLKILDLFFSYSDEINFLNRGREGLGFKEEDFKQEGG